MKPFVTVMMPARNAAATVSAAVGSALSQQGADVEVLVADDGSTDDTRRVLKSLEDARVRVLDTSGSGVAAARNQILAEARGEWLALLDADDLWLPGRLSRLLGHAETASHPLVFDDIIVHRRDGTRLSWLRNRGLDLSEATTVDSVTYTRQRLGWAKPLVSRTALPSDLRFAEYIRKTSDFHFWFRVIRRVGTALVVPEPGYVYHQHGESLSAESPDLWMQAVMGLADLLSDPSLGLDEQERSALEVRLTHAWARYHRIRAQDLWGRGRRRQTALHVARRPVIIAERGQAAFDALARPLVSGWSSRASRHSGSAVEESGGERGLPINKD